MKNRITWNTSIKGQFLSCFLSGENKNLQQAIYWTILISKSTEMLMIATKEHSQFDNFIYSVSLLVESRTYIYVDTYFVI